MDTALQRLRDPDHTAVTDLARLMVDDTTATPLRDLVHPRWIAGQLATALEAFSQGDLARSFVARRLDGTMEELLAREEVARTWFPDEVDGPLRELLAHPWTPETEITLRILDQPAMRHLVAEVLTTMLTRFRTRMANLDGGLLKTIGGRAARRSRGLFGGVADLADTVGRVVKEEVEHGLDEKVRDFVSGATRDAMRAIAEHLSDPAHADAFADLRVGVLDVLLDTPVGELVAEAEKARPLEILDVVIIAIRRTVQDPAFVDRAEQRIAVVLDETGDGTLAAWLEEAGLLEVWTETTTDFLAQRLRAITATDAFEAWWAALHADG
jgi:hypothetical protein